MLRVEEWGLCRALCHVVFPLRRQAVGTFVAAQYDQGHSRRCKLTCGSAHAFVWRRGWPELLRPSSSAATHLVAPCCGCRDVDGLRLLAAV